MSKGASMNTRHKLQIMFHLVAMTAAIGRTQSSTGVDLLHFMMLSFIYMLICSCFLSGPCKWLIFRTHEGNLVLEAAIDSLTTWAMESEEGTQIPTHETVGLAIAVGEILRTRHFTTHPTPSPPNRLAPTCGMSRTTAGEFWK